MSGSQSTFPVLKGVGWGSGQGSVQASHVLPHQTISLRTLCTGVDTGFGHMVGSTLQSNVL